MQKLFILLNIVILSGCVGSMKPKTQALDFYDFGLQQANENIAGDPPVGSIGATDAVNHHKIRYRLNYRNPAQVFTYAESRWSALPADLLAQKLGNTSPGKQTKCSLNLEITAFDHVFDSPVSSHGAVQLNVALVQQGKREYIIAAQRIAETAPASTADAKGAVQALDLASSNSLRKAFAWGQLAASQHAECH